MKNMKMLLSGLIALIAGSVAAQTTPAKSPVDPVITKFNSAAAKVNAGDYNSAIAEFEEVLALADQVGDPAKDLKAKTQAQLPILHYQVAVSFMKQKNYPEAIPSLEKAIDLAQEYNNNPDIKEKSMKSLPNLLIATANQKYKEKNYDEAIKYFQAALKYTPDEVRSYLGMGFVYADQNDEAKMTENLQKAIEISKSKGDTKNADNAQKKLGLYYTNRGNIDLEDLEEENPDYSFAVVNYEKAISFDPSAADAYYQLARISNLKMEYDKTIQYGLKALEGETVDVKKAAINYELGIAYTNTAEYPKACEAFTKAMVGPVAEQAQARKAKVPGCN